MEELRKWAMDLQRFSEYAPANPNTNTTGSEGMSDENKTYYHDTLVDNAEPYLVHDQFGMEINIPEHGGKTVEVRYFDVLDKNTNALEEGVTPDGSNLSMDVLTATVSQYGDYVTISDVLNTTAIDPILVQATKAMGSQAGRSLDTITRDIITAGTNVLYAPEIDGDTVTEIESRDEITDKCILTPDVIMRAQAELEANLAEPINGSYVAIIHPYAAYDLMRSPEFIEWHKYAQPGELYRGEIGMIGNVRFVKSTEAKIVEIENAGLVADGDGTEVPGGSDDSGSGSDDSGEDAGVTTTAVFLTMVLGKDAYATTYATGLGLEHIVKPLGSGDDPLNQRCTAGWKATKTALRIKEQNMIRIESGGHFSATAKAN